MTYGVFSSCKAVKEVALNSVSSKRCLRQVIWLHGILCKRVHTRTTSCITMQYKISGIGVNAAGVAGVATPPPIFDLQGSSCVDDLPPIFWQVFYFFPLPELLNTASRCHSHLQCAPQFFETPPPSPLTAPRFSRLRHSTCDPLPPMFQWRWRPWYLAYRSGQRS